MKAQQYIFKSLWQYKHYLYCQLICVLLIATDLAGKPYLFKLIVDFISGVQNVVFHTTSDVIFIFIIIQFSVFMIWRVYFWCNLSYEPLLKNKITLDLLGVMFDSKYQFFEKKSPGNIVGHIRDISNYIPQINNIIFGFIKIIWLFILAATTLWFVHPIFTALVIGWSVCFIIVPLSTLDKFHNASTKTAETYTRVYDVILDAVKNILPVRVFLGQEFELEKLRNIQKIYTSVSRTKRYIFSQIYLIQGLIVVLYQLLYLLLLFWFYNHNQITVGDFTLVLIINITLMANLWQTSEEIRMCNEYYSIISYALQSLEIKENKFSIDESQVRVTSGEITIFDLEFSYHSHFTTLSIPFLKIESGQKVGIVGLSGSGKTTFAKLLMKFYDLNKGEILIGNNKISDIECNTLMRLISFVPQEITIFNGSILDNIRYGDLSSTDNDVVEVSKKAQIHNFIKTLPTGYHTIIGEDNIQISTGEKQRLIIARALLKNSQIFIFDEHTSHQDSISELWLKTEFDKSFNDKTVLVIAHRLSVLEKMDRVLVFDSGKVVQDGVHKQLIKEEGVYKNLWEQQSLK